MPRWILFLPVALLAVLAGLIGLRQGWLAARLTETDVIAIYATQYARETGGRPETDCFAEPGAVPGIWLVVRCISGDGAGEIRYPVNRRGRLVPDPVPRPEKPEA